MVENKLSSELKLALELPEDIRAKSLDLDVGYNSIFQEWELIVRYTGNLTRIKEELGILVEELYGEYGIVRISKNLIGKLADYSEINYIEKPKNLLVEWQSITDRTCVNPVQIPPYSLHGNNVLIACIDSGVDIFHEAFRNKDGTTKISILWDQTIPGNPPSGFYLGSVYEQTTLNQMIENQDNAMWTGTIPFDTTGHGTAVLGIIEQMAPEAEYIVVKMGSAERNGFPRTTRFMEAVEFALRYAIEKGKPLVINISYGNNYGAHNGNSILEQYLERVASAYKNVLVAGTGNEGLSGRHYTAQLDANEERRIPIYVSNYLQHCNLQIWTPPGVSIDIWIESPEGRRIGPITPYSSSVRYSFVGEEIAVWYGEVTPYNNQNEVYIAWIPKGKYITDGIWNILLKTNNNGEKRIELWLPVSGSTSSDVFFLEANRNNTLVIPSTAKSLIAVGAYNSENDTFAAFSGRGREEDNSINKPNLVAPGVNVVSALNGGGYGTFTGTSFAAPFVSGAAALLMEWGIVNGNDPYMFGEKLRVAVEQGAKRLPYQDRIPSVDSGWGALCVAESIKKWKGNSKE